MTEEERQEIVLLDEDGQEHTFHLIEVVVVDDQRYALLQAAEEETDSDSDEDGAQSAYLFRVESDGEDDRLVAVEDDDEFDRVAEALEEMDSEYYEEYEDDDHDHDHDH